MTLVAGSTIGPYRIIEQVGKGGMATVYKAYHAALARNVAIKVLPAYMAQDEVFRERFRAEAVTIGKLRHPNILAVYDFGEESGVHYIVTEFVDGGTLADQLGAALPVDYVARMLAPVASALDYAHARDVVHRDVKPSNVLIARDGTPIVSDFGLARMLMGSMPRLTQTGALVGTPEYMAPEQAAGEEAGPAADRYALAIIAYEMLVGSVPYTADTPLATLIAHLHKPLPLPRERNPRLSTAVEEVLLRGLAKEPAARYATASELVRTLDAAANAPSAPAPAAMPWKVEAPSTPAPAAATSTAPVVAASAARVAAPAPPAAKGQDQTRRNLIAGAGILLLLLLLGGGGAEYYLANQQEEGPPITLGLEVSSDTIELPAGGGSTHPVEVTIDYSNGRDAVLTDVTVLIRPMRDARVAHVAGGLEPELSTEGALFKVGDLGPWASGQLRFLVAFESAGSRIVQATVRANELTEGATRTASINVLPPGQRTP